MYVQELEEIEYEEGCRFTADLLARIESLECGAETPEDWAYIEDLKARHGI